MTKSRLCQLLSDDQLKSSAGCCPEKLVMPNPFKRRMADSLRAMGASDAKNALAMKAPMSTPATITRFHDSLFQSYFRKSKLLGTTAAHMCRNDELMPKVRLRKIKCSGTISPMTGPATYHGHGWLIH